MGDGEDTGDDSVKQSNPVVKGFAKQPVGPGIFGEKRIFGLTHMGFLVTKRVAPHEIAVHGSNAGQVVKETPGNAEIASFDGCVKFPEKDSRKHNSEIKEKEYHKAILGVASPCREDWVVFHPSLNKFLNGADDLECVAIQPFPSGATCELPMV
jgi:hypothetical protein